jgi:hypothetical protein
MYENIWRKKYKKKERTRENDILKLFWKIKKILDIIYIKATVVSICPGNFQPLPGRTDKQTPLRYHTWCPDLCFFFLMGFVFCDNYYPTNGGGQHEPGGARARGRSTGALCTRFTLIIKKVWILFIFNFLNLHYITFD